jgi:hypothetical protein
MLAPCTNDKILTVKAKKSCFIEKKRRIFAFEFYADKGRAEVVKKDFRNRSKSYLIRRNKSIKRCFKRLSYTEILSLQGQHVGRK